MKIQRAKRSHKKPLFLTLFLVILLGLAYLVYAYSTDAWPFQKSETADPSSANDSKIQGAASDTQKNKLPATNENIDPTKTTDQIPVAENATATIDELSQNGGNVTYRASIAGMPDGATCSAEFSSSIGKPVIRVGNVTGQTCSATVPSLEFDYIGTWKLTLRVYSGDTQAVAEREVAIQ